MKLVILTSDILDGIIVSQSILRSGKDVRAIVYERKPRTLKSFVKRALFRLRGVIAHVDYAGMALERDGLIVKEVDDINADAARSVLKETLPDLIVVIGTRKLRKDIFGRAPLGAINMHSGILPYYRGADSEFWALYNGEEDKIGVSIHFIDEALDSGDIVLRAELPVRPSEDYKSLRMRNILLGAEKMVEAIGLIESGRYDRIKQDENLARTYRSARRDDLKRYREKTLRC